MRELYFRARNKYCIAATSKTQTSTTAKSSGMKSIIVKLLMGLFLLFEINTVAAQSSANYVFATNTSSSFTDMSSGTTQLIASGQDDNASAATNIGFDFWLMGKRYNQFNVTSNGLLGITSTGTTVT